MKNMHVCKRHKSILLPDAKTPDQLFKWMLEWFTPGFEFMMKDDYDPKEYLTMSPELFYNNHGVGGFCWDYVEFEKVAFEDLFPNMPILIYFTGFPNDNDVNHTFLLFKKHNKWYNFEVSWLNHQGIQQFDTPADAIEWYQRTMSKEFNTKGIYITHSFNGIDRYRLSPDEYLRRFYNKNLVVREMTTKERNALPNSEFGIPSQRKYPLHDKEHVESAIKLFGHVDKDNEALLAGNIKKAMKKFDIPKDAVGENNRLYRYL